MKRRRSIGSLRRNGPPAENIAVAEEPENIKGSAAFEENRIQDE
jgi:hypothetical protein